MNRFAAWSMGTRLDDPEGRYRVVYGQQPTRCAEGALVFNELSIQDAEQPPVAWQPRKTWDNIVGDANAWLRRAGGYMIHGWGQPGNNRFAVNLGANLPWPTIVAECQRRAREANRADGIHMDDLAVRSHFDPKGKWHDRDKWRVNVEQMVGPVTGPSSCSGWKEFYTPLDLLRRFSYVKMEGFRFAPRFAGSEGWSGPASDRFTWETWWGGRDGFYGIRILESFGITPVIEASYDPRWSKKKRDAYALISVVTACLADRALLAYHEAKKWDEPVWTDAHEKAWRLRGANRPCYKNGPVWCREFYNGHVVMNPTTRAVGNCAAHSGMIVLER